MHRCRHVFPLSQFGFEPPDAKSVPVLPRCDSHRLPERALQMGSAPSRDFRKRAQRNPAVRFRFDLAAHPANEIGLRAAARLSWMAATAGSEPGSLRRFRLNEEKNLRAVRASRWARRPAVDPGRADRVDERAVHSCVMQGDCGKASLPRHGGKRG